MREGVTAYFPSDQLPPIVSLCNRVVSFVLRRRIIKYQRSDRLARAMARLGPSYVKMGQFLATRPDIVGEKLSEDLGLLQDKMDFFPTRTAKFFVSASLKSPIEELYHEFNDRSYRSRLYCAGSSSNC